ncbi:MAG: hypothetical protein IPK21_12055 [Haliscomenobacter sp.]|nr:hypothetical protein [Haliscomenobacter sp.]
MPEMNENKNVQTPPRITGMWWLYLLLAFFFIGQWLVSSTSAQQEVSYKVFASEMLQKAPSASWSSSMERRWKYISSRSFWEKATSNR